MTVEVIEPDSRRAPRHEQRARVVGRHGLEEDELDGVVVAAKAGRCLRILLPPQLGPHTGGDAEREDTGGRGAQSPSDGERREQRWSRRAGLQPLGRPLRRAVVGIAHLTTLCRTRLLHMSP